MIKVRELTENLEKYEKFIVYFCAKVLRSIKNENPKVENELLNLIKGKVFGLPLDILVQYIEKMEHSEDFIQKLVRALHNRHKVLMQIIEFLVREIGGDTVHSPLLTMAENGEQYERAFALVVLTCLNHRKARESLREELNKFSRILRWSILTLLEKEGNVECNNLFLAALEDSEPEVAAVAAQALGKSGTTAFANHLLPLLTKSYEPLVIAAVQSLGMLKVQDAVMPLIELAIQTKSDRVRATVLTALGDIPESKTIPILAKFLQHHDPRVRANAVRALSKKFLRAEKIDEEIIRKMKALLQDPEHRVKADAILSLWEMGRIESVESIQEMTKDPNPLARSSGAYLIGKLKLFQLKEQLCDLTNDESWNVRKTAAIALLALGNVGKMSLEDLAQHGTHDQQVCAALALSLSENKPNIDNIFAAAKSDHDLTELATELLLS